MTDAKAQLGLGRLGRLVGCRGDDAELLDAMATYGLEADEQSGVIYWESYEHGLSLSFAHGRVDAVFFHGEGDDEAFSEFRGVLPLGLEFGVTPDEVVARLGRPEKTNWVETEPFSRTDVFSCEGRVVAVSYDDSSRLKRLTVMQPGPSVVGN